MNHISVDLEIVYSSMFRKYVNIVFMPFACLTYMFLFDASTQQRHTLKSDAHTFKFQAVNCDLRPLRRLQLKPGLFSYRHHPKNVEMGSDRSSLVDNWTDLCKVSMRVVLVQKVQQQF